MKLRVTARTLFLSQPSPEASPSTPVPVPFPVSTLEPVPTPMDPLDYLARTIADGRTDTGATVRNPLSLEELSLRLHSRIMFLLEIEARSSDKVVDCMDEGDHQSSSWTQNSKESFLATQNLAQDLELVMGNNMSFIMDPRTSIPHIRAVLDNVQSTYTVPVFTCLTSLSPPHQMSTIYCFFLTYFFSFLIFLLNHFRISVLASNRNSGLKALRNSLDQVTEDLGCGVRCAMLLDFPNTIRHVVLLSISIETFYLFILVFFCSFSVPSLILSFILSLTLVPIITIILLTTHHTLYRFPHHNTDLGTCKILHLPIPPPPPPPLLPPPPLQDCLSHLETRSYLKLSIRGQQDTDTERSVTQTLVFYLLYSILFLLLFLFLCAVESDCGCSVQGIAKRHIPLVRIGSTYAPSALPFNV